MFYAKHGIMITESSEGKDKLDWFYYLLQFENYSVFVS